MSCWHRTVALRIPASALGFKYRREWNEFLAAHDDNFEWEVGSFCESVSDSYPSVCRWKYADFHAPDRLLDSRDPAHPEIVPGPFLDYYLEDICPLPPELITYHEFDRAVLLSGSEKETYLPVYQSLFPHFTLKDMNAVRRCVFEWYDGSGASYLYSDYDDD